MREGAIRGELRAAPGAPITEERVMRLAATGTH